MANKRIGALWKHTKDKMQYLTGNLEVIAGFPIKICIFKNTKKTKENQPDFNIVLSENKAEKPKAEVVKPEEAFI